MNAQTALDIFNALPPQEQKRFLDNVVKPTKKATPKTPKKKFVYKTDAQIKREILQAKKIKVQEPSSNN